MGLDDGTFSGIQPQRMYTESSSAHRRIAVIQHSSTQLMSECLCVSSRMSGAAVPDKEGVAGFRL